MSKNSSITGSGLEAGSEPTPGRHRGDDRPPPIRVLLADDHPVVRMGLRKLIGDQPDIVLVAEARSGDEAVASLDCEAEVAVLDYHLGGRHDGLWVTRRIKSSRPAPRVLIYSAFADSALAAAAIVAGADGVLGKASLGEELCDAIRQVAHGGQYLPEVPRPVAQAMHSQLRPDDQAIFGMLMAGIAPEEIAECLGIAPAELEARRAGMLLAMAPAATAAHERGDMPLDYDRPRRRARYPVA